MRCRLHAPAQRRHDGRRDFVLDGEDVFELAVVALRPDVCLGEAVDELDGDAHTVGRLADASLYDVVDAEFLGDAPRRHRLALVHENGVA